MTTKLLAIDVGNTNTVLGLFEGQGLKKVWRVPSRRQDLLILSRKLPRGIGTVVVSSVVPSIDPILKEIARRLTGHHPLFVSHKSRLPIRIRVRNPRQVGQDRIINAAAAYVEYGVPSRRSGGGLLIVDFGTATTIDVVTARGDYVGGTISPGLGIANEALHEKTALLPLVPIQRPRRVVGHNTREAIQSGVFYGYAGLIDGLVRRIQRELGSKVRVIATGGLSTVVGPVCETIDVIDPDLTLKGLQRLHEWTARPPS